MLSGLLIQNIKCLVQVEAAPRIMVSGSSMSKVGTIENAFVLIRNGQIESFGRMEKLEPSVFENLEIIDAAGRHVFPSFCDPHTHLVYAGSREKEFTDKIRGLSYEEIARRGGGILNSARLLHERSEDEL